MKLIIEKIIDKVTADAHVIKDVSRYDKVLLIVDYIRASSAEGTITVYSCADELGIIKAAAAIAPILTGTIDADGAVAYTTSTTVIYEVKNIAKWLYVDWNETVDGATFSCWLLGKEEGR